jgi:two-component system sensor histidine kinase DesK
VREAVTNVIRHSRARCCDVRVTAGLAEAAAEVVDDGVGRRRSPSAVEDAPPASLPEWAGNGLTGLAERLAALGGHLDLSAQSGGGFRLRASVPTPASLAGAPT